MANALYNLALKYSLGDKIKNDFIDNIKFVNYLLEYLGVGRHHIALQRLQDSLEVREGYRQKISRRLTESLEKG